LPEWSLFEPDASPVWSPIESDVLPEWSPFVPDELPVWLPFERDGSPELVSPMPVKLPGSVSMVPHLPPIAVLAARLPIRWCARSSAVQEATLAFLQVRNPTIRIK